MSARRAYGLTAYLSGVLAGMAIPAVAEEGSDLATVLDLCVENVNEAPQTGAAFEGHGWALIGPEQYDDAASVLADADVANNATASSTGPDFERARQQYRTMRLNALKATDGDYSWAEAYRAPGQGIVLVSSNAAPKPGKVACMFVSPDPSEIAAMRAAILGGAAPGSNGVAQISVAEGHRSNAAAAPGRLFLHMMTIEGTKIEDALGAELLTSAALTVTFTPD